MKFNMAKINSQIQRFHDSVDAFYIAFHSTFIGSYDSDNDAHQSHSNDHSELESSNPADTIPVATFLRNEQLPDEIIKKQYFIPPNTRILLINGSRGRFFLEMFFPDIFF